LAKLHHPDIQKHQASLKELEEMQRTFVRITQEYESRMKVLVGDFGNDDASSAPPTDGSDEPTYDDALRPFFGELDR
jgi:DnaJ-class molecular chaperone